MLFNSQVKKYNFGLLLMRLGLAAALILHAVPKLMGGAAAWKNFGMGLGILNIGLPLKVVGLAILLLESLCSLSLLTGYLFRASSGILSIIFAVYFLNYHSIGYKTLPIFALGLVAVYIGLMYIGPGRYSIAVKLEKK